MNNKQHYDGMLIATLLTTIFYSATYPYIHKEIISNIDDSIIALNQIITCLSIIFFSSLWNKKSDKLFQYYSIFCIIEIVLSISSAIYVTLTHNILSFYIIDTLIIAIITRNILCGGVKLQAIRYNSEKLREQFDNNNNSAYAIATIIGSIIAMILNLNFNIMIWLATIGGIIDNIFYIIIYNKEKGGENV